MSEEIAALRRDLERLAMRLDSQERMISALMAGGNVIAGGQTGLLPKLTTKQHVTLQMLLAGKSNAEIAARLGITENGAKVHVRLICKKAGVNTRSQIVMKAYDEFREVGEGPYEIVSGGLPKTWSERWMLLPVEDDPYARLYRSDG